ncbi:MAG: hypothetical protein JEZ08_24570, partial [Clostridiales bacterium]|nr:hypothetical protein [Clostridiales bacterium]
MTRDLLKRIMALTLAFLVATVGLPFEAFADNLTHNQTKLNGMLFVQHYDVSDETTYPGPSSVDQNGKGNWLTFEANANLSSTVLKKKAELGNDNWTQSEDASVFLNSRSGTKKTAFVAKGNLHLSQDTYLRAVSDDGVKFSLDGTEESAWALQTNGKTTPMQADSGDYVFEMTYFNWGGNGKLLFQKLPKNVMNDKDFDINTVPESAWETVPWNWFYIGVDKEVVEPILTPVLKVNDEVKSLAKSGDALTVDHETVDLSEGWTVSYEWIVKSYDGTSWNEQLLSETTDTLDLDGNYGKKIYAKVNLILNNEFVKEYVTDTVDIINLYVTADDYYDLYVDGSNLSMNPATGNHTALRSLQNDGHWETVDYYYLSPESYGENPLFAVKTWDQSNGGATISGFRLAYFTPSQSWVKSDNQWYEWHNENDLNNDTVDLDVLPTDYKNIDWYSPSYNGNWTKAIKTSSEAGGWSNTSNQFPAVSNSEWIWSQYFKVGQTVVSPPDGFVGPLRRFESPVYFRNTLTGDQVPTIATSDLTMNQQDAGWDPTEGVTYSDAEDNNPTLTVSIVNEDNSLTPVAGNIDVDTAKVFTLRYVVTDSAGQTASVDRVITVNDVPVDEVPVVKVTPGTNFNTDVNVTISSDDTDVKAYYYTLNGDA